MFESPAINAPRKMSDAGASSSSKKTPTADLAWRALKKQNPQKTIDGFWRKFVTRKPGKIFRLLPEDLYAKRAAAKAPHGVVSAHSASASFDEAVATCKAKVEKIRRECRLKNQKYTDLHFDIEADLKWGRRECLNGLVHEDYERGKGPRSVKRVPDIFEDPQFFVDGASAGDVRQGREGDCWFMAALSSLSNDTRLVERMCVARDEGRSGPGRLSIALLTICLAAVGVYGFVFYRDGEWISTIVDDKLYLTKPDYDESYEERRHWDDRERVDSEEEYRKAYQTGSGALYFAQCSDPNETWVPILEKAYAKSAGDYSAICGGNAGEALEDLTGGVSTEIYTSDILDRELFWQEELLNANKHALFSCFTGIFGGWGERKGIQEMHEYSILRAVEVAGERLLLLRNPWGRVEWTGAWSDGSAEWTPEWLNRLQHRFGNDGSFWISYRDLLRKYQCLTRTRLFGPEWSVTQQWTSLQVPWSVDYLDTKFAFEITKPGPVVVVLSQLDDRYFRGLDGQYTFDLHFRLHKDGEEDYIVRSSRAYCLARSVSTEVELEPGHYSVLIKIDATRDLARPAPEDVVRKCVHDKREKLLQIGLSYDLAHAKGQIKETDAEKKTRRQARTNLKRAALRKRKEEILAARAKAKRKAAERAERKEAKRAHRRAQAEFARRQAKQANNDNDQKPDEGQEAKKGQDNQSQGGRSNASRAASPRNPPQKPAKPARLCSLPKSKATPNGDAAPEPLVNGTSTKSDEQGPDPAVNGDHVADAPSTNGAPAGDENESETQTTKDDEDRGTAKTKDDIDGKSGQHEDGEDGEHDDGEDDGEDDDQNGQQDDHEEEIEDNDDDVSTDIETPSIATSVSVESDPSPAALYEDDFAKFPWNAVCVVGLRVYSKDQDVTIEVVRPRETDVEAALDPDDLAADAAKEGREMNEVEKGQQREEEEGEEKGSEKKDVQERTTRKDGDEGRVGNHDHENEWEERHGEGKDTDGKETAQMGQNGAEAEAEPKDEHKQEQEQEHEREGEDADEMSMPIPTS